MNEWFDNLKILGNFYLQHLVQTEVTNSQKPPSVLKELKSSSLTQYFWPFFILTTEEILRRVSFCGCQPFTPKLHFTHVYLPELREP
jgi:hypothetical protein